MDKLSHRARNAARSAKRQTQKVTKYRQVRFGLVGIVNTITDFGLLNILVSIFHVPVFAANICSTSAALIVSYSLNKKTVFKGGEGNARRQFILFLIVSLSAVWIVQTGIMFGLYHLFQAHSSAPAALLLNVAKLIGIGGGLIWNYIFYSRLVFKKDTNKK